MKTTLLELKAGYVYLLEGKLDESGEEWFLSTLAVLGGGENDSRRGRWEHGPDTPGDGPQSKQTIASLSNAFLWASPLGKSLPCEGPGLISLPSSREVPPHRPGA